MTDVPDGSAKPAATAEEDGLRWLRFFLLAIAAVGAILIHITKDVPLGWALMALFVGWPLLGTLVTIDDDLPGGWSNPDGTVTPPWKEAPFWAQLILGCAIACGGFAVDAGWTSGPAVRWWLAAVGAGSLGLALALNRKWLLIGALALLFGPWSHLP